MMLNKNVATALTVFVLALGLAMAPQGSAEEKNAREQKSARTSSEDILNALRAHVADVLQIEPDAVAIRLLSPADDVRLHPSTPITHAGTGKPVGRVTFMIGGFRINTEVEARKDVVVAARFLRRNQVLEQGDLTITPVRVVWSEGRYVVYPEIAVGKRLTRNIPSRFPVTEDVLGEPYTLRQGMRITIRYQSGPLRVLVMGIAKEDGAVGASIRVTNLDSKKDVWARVVDDETVQVGP
jgi:flagella basal body P-ring formation protein FlgA